ncbi:hypothetical protein N7468_010518 [Penicillium chermesinum]|uniref:Uncharacterized protein n=1 Tax=Penicillium chermesinum TaxID=63820 RepID=A0A9W9N953_9EURO|nr:uncharacterized protein N7468_010518 [Penicillium chermesinum]KAJ5214839.1 hypothetical protein N7468_010518 [Penicillium chermesinum]KAJ6141657.1 hypothetical protein N7470_010047 [Penicillium chermesinum]
MNSNLKGDRLRKPQWRNLKDVRKASVPFAETRGVSDSVAETISPGKKSPDTSYLRLSTPFI